MSRRRVAAPAGVRLTRAIGQRGAKADLALANLLDEVRYPQHGRQHHNDKYRGTHIGVLPRNQQLESGHGPPPLTRNATAVPVARISPTADACNRPTLRRRPFGNALEERIRSEVLRTCGRCFYSSSLRSLPWSGSVTGIPARCRAAVGRRTRRSAPLAPST